MFSNWCNRISSKEVIDELFKGVLITKPLRAKCAAQNTQNKDVICILEKSFLSVEYQVYQCQTHSTIA